MTQPYENYPLNNNPVYRNINEFIECNKQFKDEDKIIIYLINWPSGFGSALTVFMQNMYYLHSINKTAHVLPMFCMNTRNFKYHDTSLNNSFFKYFSYSVSHIDMSTHKIFFIYSMPIDGMPFFTGKIPPMQFSAAKEYICHFNKYFKVRIGDHIAGYINSIRSNSLPVIGIHIRSLGQKHAHCPWYLSKSIKDRLVDLKLVLDAKWKKYNVFIATDVNFYINYAEEVFGTVHYIRDISRINNEGDSIPQLSNIGTNLGNDIIYDCIALSLCDEIGVSESNIPAIVSTFNPDARMIEY